MNKAKAGQIEEAGDVAFEACRKINPTNLLRAAMGIVSAFEALKKIASWDFSGDIDNQVEDARGLARRVFLNATDRD